jgi:undecaprenyl-diphosphatase
LKNFFNRQRPISTNHCPTDFSFPSGHAATAFSAATVLTFFDKKRRFFYSTIALLIAYSRLYLSCHYFFDVLGGGVLGIIIGKLILNMMKKY